MWLQEESEARRRAVEKGWSDVGVWRKAECGEDVTADQLHSCGFRAITVPLQLWQTRALTSPIYSACYARCPSHLLLGG